jgi:hypothetical protein
MAQPETVPAGDEVTELPSFVVEEKLLVAPKESWRYTTVPGFEILTNVSDRNATRFLKEFLRYRVILGALFPMVESVQDEAPTTLILCREKSFSQFMPGTTADEREFRRTLYRSDRERTAIVIDMTAGEVGRDEDLRLVYDPYLAINREYFRFLLRKILGSAAAPWLETGLMHIVGATEYTGNTISFGRLGDSHSSAKTGSFHTYFAGQPPAATGAVSSSSGVPRGNPVMTSPASPLSAGAARPGRAFLPMSKMFARPDGLSPAERLTWEMQCYAFIHLCILGNRGELQKGLLTFVDKAATQPVTEELFKECFGKNYRQIGAQLRSYCEFTTFKVPVLKLENGQKFPEPSSIVLREATDAEIGRLKGDALRLGGFADQARLNLIAPYMRGEREPELLAALGLVELAGNQPGRARKFLEKAHAGKTTRVLALIELARLRLAEARQAPAGKEGRLNNAQLVSVLTPLFAARQHKPVLADTYELIAEAWTQAETRPSAAQLEVLDEGTLRFPRDVTLVLAATEAYAAHGFAEKTALYASLGEKITSAPATKKRFAELKAALPDSMPATP